MDDATPSLGHNRPPADIIDPDDPEILRARLERVYADMTARFVELELGAAQVPAAINTDREASNVVDWIAQQCRVLIAKAEQAHTTEKRPYLVGGRVVDRFFNDRIKQLQTVIAPIERRVALYHRRKREEAQKREAAERARAAALQREAKAKADRLAQEALQREQAGDRQAAIRLTQESEEQEANAAVATARLEAPPEPVYVHGEYGATGYSREVWTFEVEDPAAVPLGFLTVDEEAVQQAIKEGVREIPGLRIFQTDKFTIRRC